MRIPISIKLAKLIAGVEELEKLNNNLARQLIKANILLVLTEQAFDEMGIQKYGWNVDKDDNPVVKNGLLHQIREYLYS